jgi:hypothetical protein
MKLRCLDLRRGARFVVCGAQDDAGRAACLIGFGDCDVSDIGHAFSEVAAPDPLLVYAALRPRNPTDGQSAFCRLQPDMTATSG